MAPRAKVVEAAVEVLLPGGTWEHVRRAYKTPQDAYDGMEAALRSLLKVKCAVRTAKKKR